MRKTCRKFVLAQLFSLFAAYFVWAEILPVKTYTTADGLLRNGAFCVKQDSRGFIWVCTGDGKADVAFWRPSIGFWFVLRSEDFSFFSFPFGAAGDIPLQGDYDGDGRTDAGVFRPSTTNWFVQRSTQGTLILQFGINGDFPIPNSFVP